MAQSPHEMRGLMVGLWSAAYGIGTLSASMANINLNVKLILSVKTFTISSLKP